MAHFPVSSSILSAAHLADFIKVRYQLSENTTARLLKAGVNHSYLVTDGANKFVYRVYSLAWRSVREIEEEINLLLLLKEQGIPVSYPVADPANQYIQEMPAPEGMRYGLLFSYAPGSKILSYSTDIHYRVGVAMANMHKITQGLTLERVTYDSGLMHTEAVQRISPFIDNKSDEFIFLQKIAGYAATEFEKLSTSTLRRGIVHLDIWYDNMHFDKDGNITIFDFDFIGNGWLCFDIAYYTMQLHKIEKDDNEYKVKLKSFMDGYESVLPISGEEKKAIPVLGMSVFIFFLGVQCYRFENWTNAFLNEIHVGFFISLLLKRWYNYHQLPEVK